MCIIIDACCLAVVFSGKVEGHEEFKPVKDWISDGKGKMVYGGTKYKEELKRAKRYHRIVNELRRAGRAIEVDLTLVDHAETEVIAKTCHTTFNDQHLLAIVIISRCRLLCTEDKAAIPFIKDNSLYPRGIRKPKIYSGRKGNARLLNDANIATICVQAYPDNPV